MRQNENELLLATDLRELNLMSGVATSSSFSVVFPITVPILLLLPFFEPFLAPLTIIPKTMRPGASPEAVKKITFQ